MVAALLVSENTYIPPEAVPQFNKECAAFFIAKAIKETEDKKLQIFC